MSTHLKLEQYLATLDNALRSLSTTERAEIIVEIKSHVLSTLEKDPSQTLDGVLSSLGEPETVANRYLMEGGKIPAKPPISPIIKWLVIGFLGTVAMLLVFASFMALKFAPILRESGGNISIGRSTHLSQGSRVIEASEKRPLVIRFLNAKMEIRTSEDREWTWECSGARGKIAQVAETEKELVLDFKKVGGVSCEINIPKDTQLVLEGNNGKIEIEQPAFQVQATVINGKFDISPDPELKYNYRLSVVNGKTDTFDSSNAPGALQISVSLTNGLISND